MNNPNQYQPLFDHMAQEHGLTLLESEMHGIIYEVEKLRGLRCKECGTFGKYIRTRYFEGSVAHVMTCKNEKCETFHLYWHIDCPFPVFGNRIALTLKRRSLFSFINNTPDLFLKHYAIMRRTSPRTVSAHAALYLTKEAIISAVTHWKQERKAK